METNQIFLDAEFNESRVNDGVSSSSISNDNEQDQTQTGVMPAERREFDHQRLLINQIEHLLKAQVSTGSTIISRAALPGLTAAIELTLDPAVRASFDEEADRLLEAQDRNPRAVKTGRNRLMLDILIELGIAFEPFDRRAAWFLKTVNGQNPSGANNGGLCKESLMLVLRNIFIDLRCGVECLPGRQMLEAIYGTDTIERTERILRDLWGPAPEHLRGRSRAALPEGPARRPHCYICDLAGAEG